MPDTVQVSTLRRNAAGYQEGAYRDGSKTGLLTGVSAPTATAGHIWAVRWAPAVTEAKRRLAVVTRLRARWFTIAGFTAAQEVGFDLYKLTGYTVAHSGSTALAPQKKNAVFPTAIMTGQIATTGDVTAGTQTIGTDQLASASYAELAAAATVPKGAFEIFLSTEDLDRYPIVLAANEGLLLRNSILMGAGGTARVSVEMDWLEVERY